MNTVVSNRTICFVVRSFGRSCCGQRSDGMIISYFQTTTTTTTTAAAATTATTRSIKNQFHKPFECTSSSLFCSSGFQLPCPSEPILTTRRCSFFTPKNCHSGVSSLCSTCEQQFGSALGITSNHTALIKKMKADGDKIGLNPMFASSIVASTSPFNKRKSQNVNTFLRQRPAFLRFTPRL